jgi:hypothetical protein
LLVVSAASDPLRTKNGSCTFKPWGGYRLSVSSPQIAANRRRFSKLAFQFDQETYSSYDPETGARLAIGPASPEGYTLFGLLGVPGQPDLSLRGKGGVRDASVGEKRRLGGTEFVYEYSVALNMPMPSSLTPDKLLDVLHLAFEAYVRSKARVRHLPCVVNIVGLDQLD